MPEVMCNSTEAIQTNCGGRAIGKQGRKDSVCQPVIIHPAVLFVSSVQSCLWCQSHSPQLSQDVTESISCAASSSRPGFELRYSFLSVSVSARYRSFCTYRSVAQFIKAYPSSIGGSQYSIWWEVLRKVLKTAVCAVPARGLCAFGESAYVATPFCVCDPVVPSLDHILYRPPRSRGQGRQHTEFSPAAHIAAD